MLYVHTVPGRPRRRTGVPDGRLNAIVRVEPGTGEGRTVPHPADRDNANLNTASVDDALDELVVIGTS